MQIADKTAFDGGRFSTLDLSSGQRKRLALIVALLEDRPILVLDEWAADQDPHFRQYFYETMIPDLKARGKTVIAATHDDRYFHVADRVIKLEYGEQLRDS
jgi:putative pyoverdin transport system ATP-binding/permease protein